MTFLLAPARPARRASVGGATTKNSAFTAVLVSVGWPALLVAALAAVGVVHVWSRTRVTTAGYRLGELQRTRTALQAERDRLEVGVAALRAPGRLERFALERLGMVPPMAGTVVGCERDASGIRQ